MAWVGYPTQAMEGIEIAEVHAQRSRAITLPGRRRVGRCRERGLSRAEALRQALRLWLQQQRPSHSEVFGLWRDRPEDSVELQQVLRAQWSER
jgi:hypothetical protein